MSDERQFNVKELAAHVGGRLVGDESVTINRVADLENAGTNEIAYVEESKHFATARESGASCLLVPEGFDFTSQARLDGQVAIFVARPKLAFARIAALLHPPKQHEPKVHETAIVAESASIALTVAIGPYAVIGENSTVGAGTRIEAGVVIGDNVTIGNDCVLHRQRDSLRRCHARRSCGAALPESASAPMVLVTCAMTWATTNFRKSAPS